MAEEQHNKAIFKSSFSMGQYDFERMNELLKSMDALSIAVGCGDHSCLFPYYYVLWELYKNFRPIIFESERHKYETVFKRVKNEIEDDIKRNGINKLNGLPQMMNIDGMLLASLDEIQMKLLDIRQIIGLGIMVDKQEANSTKLARALGVST